MCTKFIRIWQDCSVQSVLRNPTIKMCTVQNRTHSFRQDTIIICSENKNRKYPYNFITKPINVGKDQEQQEYMSVFPDIVDTLVNASTDIPELKERYRKLLYENVPKGKQGSGFLTVAAYKMFEHPKKLTAENTTLANILGWCATLHFCAFLIVDDMMDASDTRCGELGWYKRKDVGMEAANDAIFMLEGIHLTLRKYLSGFKCYYPALEWFHDVTMKVAVGQTLDSRCTVSEKPRLEEFTMNKYKTLANYKGTYPSYLLPVTLGLYFADKYDSELHKQTNAILSEVGLFFISQNDILDCYGDPSITGKVGNDIPEGKCTWLIVNALQRATSAQKKILAQYYGKPDYDSEEKVRTVFDELSILDKFLNYEERSFNKVCQVIRRIPREMDQNFYFKIVAATYEQKQ